MSIVVNLQQVKPVIVHKEKKGWTLTFAGFCFLAWNKSFVWNYALSQT